MSYFVRLAILLFIGVSPLLAQMPDPLDRGVERPQIDNQVKCEDNYMTYTCKGGNTSIENIMLIFAECTGSRGGRNQRARCIYRVNFLCSFSEESSDSCAIECPEGCKSTIDTRTENLCQDEKVEQEDQFIEYIDIKEGLTCLDHRPYRPRRNAKSASTICADNINDIRTRISSKACNYGRVYDSKCKPIANNQDMKY